MSLEFATVTVIDLDNRLCFARIDEDAPSSLIDAHRSNARRREPKARGQTFTLFGRRNQCSRR